jgi:biopolymer transport protein ExbD
LTLWDVFHSDRLELERGLDDARLRDALARGDLTEDDLIRPAGSSTPWERLGDRPDLPAPAAEPEPQPPAPPPRPYVDHPTEMNTELHDRFEWSDEDEPDLIDDGSDYEHVDPERSEPGLLAFADEDRADSIDELEILDDEPAPPPISVGPILPPLDRSAAIPVLGPAPLPWDEEELEAEFDGSNEYDPLEEDEAVAEFTLARGAVETVEELDLAAMVDVAFQLVLFFLVTATTVLYKSLEVPKPNADAPLDAAVQGRTKTLDDLKADYILVEMDVTGAIKIDRQPVPGPLTMTALAEKLRTLRTDTGRQAMLFSADFYTPHRKAVLAYDAANEIGLAIKTAKPTGGANAIPPPVIKKG